MIISVNWLKKFTTIDLPIDELTKLIGARLVEIEEVIDLGKKYEGVIIAKVVECTPLEGSDHLNVTKIDDGGVIQDIARDENGLVQVVCGAPNVRSGLTVAWLPPGSTVPETYGKEPFVLGARNLRGVMSNGMLASAKELDLFDDHTGILELDESKAAGSSFADTYELNDYLLDIENKSLTHRPDTFGIIGFAREVAGIQGIQFETPRSLSNSDVQWIEKLDDLPTPQVTIDNPELSSRYQAVVLTDVVSAAQSPLETQTYLARIGVRPHSAVVDVTNYLMMLTGQPLHAFDYDKLKAVNNGQIDIHVRSGRSGEKLILIDGREIELSENDIVIANGETAVALAGAMGGRDTEIDDATTTVLLESASFNLYNLRNTQMRHGIFSEAITRFTKGQPAELTAPVLAEAVKLLSLSVDAKRASDVADVYPVKQEQPKVYAMAEHMNAALGTAFTTDTIVQTLRNVEFSVTVNDKDVITAVPPYWRADIHISEDIDEEVGRLNGYDTIAPVLPQRDFTAVSPDDFDRTRAQIRQLLARAGANEVLTYNFVHGDILKKAEQNPDDSYRIINSISPDLQYYRQSLIPSLLTLIHPNSKAGYDDFAVFELNKAHTKQLALDEDGLPQEMDQLALVITKKQSSGAAYFDAKRYLDYLTSQLGLKVSYEPYDEHPNTPASAPFDHRRSAQVLVGESPIGHIGEFKRSVSKQFKLPEHTAGFILGARELARLSHETGPSYMPLSRFPSSERDICFQVASNVRYSDLEQATHEGAKLTGLQTVIAPLDIYQSDEADTKNITFRVILASDQKTLTGEAVAEAMATLSDHVVNRLGATII